MLLQGLPIWFLNPARPHSGQFIYDILEQNIGSNQEGGPFQEREPTVNSLINRTSKLVLPGFLFLFIFITSAAADDEQAAKLEKMCQDGNSFACFTIGEKLRTLDRNNKDALVYYVKSCEGDWMTGCTNAGILKTLEGETHGDYQKKMKIWKEAGEYFKKACDAEENNACSNLGLLKYKQGRTSSAKKYYKIACDLGNNVACGLLEKLKN